MTHKNHGKATDPDQLLFKKRVEFARALKKDEHLKIQALLNEGMDFDFTPAGSKTPIQYDALNAKRSLPLLLTKGAFIFEPDIPSTVSAAIKSLQPNASADHDGFIIYALKSKQPVYITTKNEFLTSLKDPTYEFPNKAKLETQMRRALRECQTGRFKDVNTTDIVKTFNELVLSVDKKEAIKLGYVKRWNTFFKTLPQEIIAEIASQTVFNQPPEHARQAFVVKIKPKC